MAREGLAPRAATAWAGPLGARPRPSPPGTVGIANCTIAGNDAVDGKGGAGGNGGNGLGGGIYSTSNVSVSITQSTITHNDADGGAGSGGGTNGLGEGGGVYNLGLFAFDVSTVIAHNHASTSNDDIYP